MVGPVVRGEVRIKPLSCPVHYAGDVMTENALFLLPAPRRARDLIDRDYAEPLDLNAMAGEAGYSRFHFARAFTAACGGTPRSPWLERTSA